MNAVLKFGVAALGLSFAMPAQAAIIMVDANSIQGTLVHGSNVPQTALDVVGLLGANGPQIVHFTGDTTETAATSDNLRLQDGGGQADITGAEVTMTQNPNDVFNMLSGNIFLTNNAGMDFIEFALTSGARGTIDFILDDALGGSQVFNNVEIGNGNTFYGFNTTGLSAITNVRWVADSPLQISILKQVRIGLATAAPPVPEPATWAMMLLGFGGIGFAMRRRKYTTQARVRFA